MTIDRELLAGVCWTAMRDAMNRHGPFSGPTQARHIADAVIAHLSAVPVEGEVEWEYGVRAADDEEPYTDVSEDRDWVLDHALLTDGDTLVRRRKAGSWEVAKG